MHLAAGTLGLVFVLGGPVAEHDAPPAESASPPVADPDPEPRYDGKPMLIAGSVVGGLGVLSLGTGGVLIAAAVSSGGFEGLGIAVVGGMFIVGGAVEVVVGVPLAAVGGARYAKYRRWQERHGVAMRFDVGRTRYGTAVPSLRLHF